MHEQNTDEDFHEFEVELSDLDSQAKNQVIIVHTFPSGEKTIMWKAGM